MTSKGTTESQLSAAPGAGWTSFPSPRRCFIILGALLFVAEFLVMCFLPVLPELKPWVHNLADATLLLVLVSPALYYFVLRPLHHHIQERQRAEAELRLHREHLEIRVVERTAELRASNEQLQREIAEHRRAEVALQESEERYRRLVELSPDAILVSCEDRITFLNPAAQRLFGASRTEQILGKSPRELFLPDDHRALGERISRLEGGQGVPRVEEKIARLDGVVVVVEVAAAPFVQHHRRAILIILRDITARKGVEESLATASEQRRLVLEAAGMGAWDYRFDTGEVFWDERCRNQWGIGQGDQIEYARAIAAIHPDDRAAVDEAVKQALAGASGGAYHREFRVVWPDGSMHWISSRGQVFFEGEGERHRAVRFIGATHDITERKKMEEAQEFLSRCGYRSSSEDFFQALARFLAESLGMDFVCVDRLMEGALTAQTVAMYSDGKFANNVAYELRDTPCGKVVGQTICCFPKDVCQLFPKDDVLRELRAESYVGTTLWSLEGKPIGLIAVIGRKTLADPRLAESVLKLVAVRAAGELQRTLAAEALRRAHDQLELRVQERTLELQQINEDLRREVEVRRRTERELTEAESRYRTVADFTHDWEYWQAPDQVLRYCSPSCERLTGHGAQDFIANPRLLDEIVDPEDADIWQQHQHEAITEPGLKTAQFRIRRKDGDVRWMEHVSQPVWGKDGVFLGIRASNRDITQRKQAELETQRLREELAHVTRVTTAGQFAASLAHELNQPLTAISCNAEAAESFLTADRPDLKEVQEALREIRHDSQRAGGVIQNLRALFKKTGQQRSVLQLNGVIDETLELLRSEMVLNGVSVQLELAPDLPMVVGDRIELQQVVLNLFVNALEAMIELPRPLRRLRLSTNLENPGAIRTSIQDCGAGIQEKQFSRLFEPFFTTKATGMGMGLTICHSIVEAHGGQLWAVNNPDRGATFHFTLPIPQGENA